MKYKCLNCGSDNNTRDDSYHRACALCGVPDTEIRADWKAAKKEYKKQLKVTGDYNKNLIHALGKDAAKRYLILT